MGLLGKEELLAKEKLDITKVDLGKGDFVFVRQMTGRERDIFEQSIVKEITDKDGKSLGYDKSLEDFRAKLAVCTVCDKEGNLILGKDDYEKLSQNMSAARLEAIIDVAQKLNKIAAEDKDALLKNSEAAQSGNSTSGSAKN